jgi:hypothetical protein
MSLPSDANSGVSALNHQCVATSVDSDSVEVARAAVFANKLLRASECKSLWFHAVSDCAICTAGDPQAPVQKFRKYLQLSFQRKADEGCSLHSVPASYCNRLLVDGESGYDVISVLNYT